MKLTFKFVVIGIHNLEIFLSHSSCGLIFIHPEIEKEIRVSFDSLDGEKALKNSVPR